MSSTADKVHTPSEGKTSSEGSLETTVNDLTVKKPHPGEEPRTQ